MIYLDKMMNLKLFTISAFLSSLILSSSALRILSSKLNAIQMNQIFGFHVDVACMYEQLSGENPCSNEQNGSDCGKCVQILAICGNTKKPKVLPDCMRTCLSQHKSCNICIELDESCSYGIGTTTDLLSEALNEDNMIKHIQDKMRNTMQTDIPATWPLSINDGSKLFHSPAGNIRDQAAVQNANQIHKLLTKEREEQEKIFEKNFGNAGYVASIEIKLKYISNSDIKNGCIKLKNSITDVLRKAGGLVKDISCNSNDSMRNVVAQFGVMFFVKKQEDIPESPQQAQTEQRIIQTLLDEKGAFSEEYKTPKIEKFFLKKK